MQTLSEAFFIVAFVLPPVAVVLGAAALAILRSSARLPAAPSPQEAALN
jgi:hypothetical protein